MKVEDMEGCRVGLCLLLETMELSLVIYRSSLSVYHGNAYLLPNLLKIIISILINILG